MNTYEVGFALNDECAITFNAATISIDSTRVEGRYEGGSELFVLKGYDKDNKQVFFACLGLGYYVKEIEIDD
jgi:hypothetical protein